MVHTFIYTHTALVTFEDRSKLLIWHLGSEVDLGGYRQIYAYVLEGGDGRTSLSSGRDLRSAVGADVDMRAVLKAWCNFAYADGESYRSVMVGTPYAEWCYVNADSLAEVADDESLNV